MGPAIDEAVFNVGARTVQNNGHINNLDSKHFLRRYIVGQA